MSWYEDPKDDDPKGEFVDRIRKLEAMLRIKDDALEHADTELAAFHPKVEDSVVRTRIRAALQGRTK